MFAGVFIALLTPLSTAALSCNSTPAELAVQAVATTTKESTSVYTCTLAGEAAIHLGGSLVSSLDRARGFVLVRFFNGGTQLMVKQYGPWLGGFSSLAFDEAIAVPANATKVDIRAQAASTRADAKGEWRIVNLAVSPGVAVVKGAGETVITAAEKARWSFSTVPQNAQGTFRMQLRNPEGEEVATQTVQKQTDSTVIDFGQLPVGHYTASVQFTPVSGLAGDWKSTLAVLPDDDPLNEQRFGMDAGLSWGVGIKNENQIEPFLEMVRKAGVGTVRDRLGWEDVQKDCLGTNWGWTPSNGGLRYGWVAEAIAATGMESVQVFHDSPACAGVMADVPLNYDAVFNFGQEYAKNLGQTVRNIEYWNEQQAVGFFKGYPFQYASALKAFHAGVKSVDPDINVLIGSASGGPGRFFEETYLNGATAFFDTRNQHYYGRDVDGGKFIPGNYLDNFFDTSVKNLENTHGVAGKPGWITERGYSLLPQERGADGGWQVAELAQAEFLVRTYASGFAAGYERVFFFIGGEFVESEYHTWGIVRDDLSTKPAYVALAVLTRHLAGADVVAVECHGECSKSPGRTVYFQKGGSYVAVTWGGGNTAAQGSATKIQDIFGRVLTNMQSTVKPLLLSGIGSVPATARTVTLPTPKVSAWPPFMVTGALWINGKAHTSPRGDNGVDVSIVSGNTVEIVARAYTFENITGALQVECSAGPGLIQISPPRIVGNELICRFQANELDRRSHVTLRAEKGGYSDVVRVALEPDIASTVSTFSASPLLSNGQCLKWVSSSGNIDSLVIEEINPTTSTASCPTVNVKSIIKTSLTDTWVFPYANIPAGTLANAVGLRVRVANVPGVNPAPTPLMIQLNEMNGEIWLLNSDLLRGSDGVYSGLFGLTEQASWATKGNGVLDLEQVHQIRVGWGGYGTGQAGDKHGYTIEKIEALFSNPATPGTGGTGTPGTGTPGSGTDMALRDAIYLYRQPISGIAAKVKTLAGYNCDVFQMLLDVESGYTDIALLESEVASDPASVYPDRIHAGAPMFSYALYAAKPVKTFALGRFLDNAATDNIGTATVFGYCFSPRADAKVLFYDGTGVCHLSNGRAVSCSGVPDTDQW